MTTPASRIALADLYFMEHRAKLLDIAAFLDRLDRAAVAEGGPSSGDCEADFRIDAFRRALALLSDGRAERVRRILELLSDHSSEPVASAGMKGATGAVDLRAAGR